MRLRWLYALILPATICAAVTLPVSAQAYGSPLTPMSVSTTPVGNPSPPSAPPGGKVYGPYKDKIADPNGNYCNSILQNFYSQGAVPSGWSATCYLHDDGYWYILMWPPQEQLESSVTIPEGTFLISTTVTLDMQHDGNLVIYRNSDRAALWASNTVGRGGTYARMQTDGNLVIYTPAHVAVWSSGTCCHTTAELAIQNDGNVVIYVSGSPIWATGT